MVAQVIDGLPCKHWARHCAPVRKIPINGQATPFLIAYIHSGMCLQKSIQFRPLFRGDWDSIYPTSVPSLSKVRALFRPRCRPPLRLSAMGCTGLDGLPCKGHAQGVPLPIVNLFRPGCWPPLARALWNLRLSAMGCTGLDGLPCKGHAQGVPLPIVNLFRPGCWPPFARALWNLRLSAMGCTGLDGLPCKGHAQGVPLPIVNLFRPGCWPPLARALWNLRLSAMGCTGLDGLTCKGHAQGVPLLFGQPHGVLSQLNAIALHIS